ncbi:hypothetical protein T459_12192 [Capsicum annuum]|uniref:Uncharacterized protein n=1 Tax=Capsicum annuum TaxID=4072 RepID=A0A2G2ZP30_CAPAN|nr:hypothetical protein T459_12192 [Capsicum annuum]
MVSRWRKCMKRYTLHFVPNANKDVTSSVNSLCGSGGRQEIGTLPNSEENEILTYEGMSSADHENRTLPTRLNNVNFARELRQIPGARENKYLNKNVADDTVASTWKGTLLAADSGVVSYTNENPLKSQLPPSNLFSRNEMSTYFSKKVSPATYFSHEKKRLEIAEGNEIIDSFAGDRDIESQNPNGPCRNMHLPMKSSNSSANTKKKYGIHHDSATPILNRFNNGKISISVKNSVTIDASSELDTNDVYSATERRNTEAVRPSVDADMELIEGNMCTSTTGVVRAQSRRKAEMFLVRTDGFLCNREKRARDHTWRGRFEPTIDQTQVWKIAWSLEDLRTLGFGPPLLVHSFGSLY